MVQLPPPPCPTTIATTGSNITAPTSNTAPTVAAVHLSSGGGDEVNNVVVNANISNRKARMESRKRDLLLEARNARVSWVLDDGGASTSRNGDSKSEGGCSNNENRLSGLRACSADVLPCAPQIIQSMLSSNCNWENHERMIGRDTSQKSGALEQLLEKENLAWESVSALHQNEESNQGEASSLIEMAAKHSSLNLPPIPSSRYHTAFLNTLCEPSAANLVMSIQKFCNTIQEAASVMVATMQDIAENETKAEEGESNNDVAAAQINHGKSLAKAIRGFVNTTLREMEAHEAFHAYLYPDDEGKGPQNTHPVTATKDGKSLMDGVAKEQLQQSLEKFVYAKCRGDVDTVLLAEKEESDGSNSTKTIQETQLELHDKMLSLQFVTPAHLEISCLKSSASAADAHHDDVDLSYTIHQLQSIEYQSSPRQILQSILLAHRGVSVALNEACGNDNDPPGADDVLPTLILAVLRAHPPTLLCALRFVEHFAALPLLRGEAGYAYTNLCGAFQFIRELDISGHLAEVTLGGMGEGAVLSIGPEEFRTGLEESRRKMNETPKGKVPFTDPLEEDDSGEVMTDFARGNDVNDEVPLSVKITARQVREARSHGESVDLNWAVKKQNQSMWQDGLFDGIVVTAQQPETELATATERGQQQRRRRIPPEDPPLPTQFSRSYSFLTTHPDNIGLRDLPRLLKEYKLLVHATENLLNERTVWRENEQKRQLKLERQNLERDFVDAIGDEERHRVDLANGH